MIASIIATAFSILPAWFAITVLGLLAIIVIFLVVRIVSAVIDAIPFL